MRTHEKSSCATDTRAQDKDVIRENNTLNIITFLMLLTTLIAEFHISDAWSGVVSALCGIVTIILSYELIKKEGTR